MPRVVPMRTFFFSLFAVSLLLTSPAAAMSRASRPQQEAALSSPHLGVRTLHFQDPARQRAVVVELWYPTDADVPLDIPKNSIWVHPEERRNAPLMQSKAQYPLILMSHGHRGDRRETTWLAASLVKQGYIVAAVEHYGNSLNTYNSQISACFWERSRDVSFALDTLLKIDWLKDQVDLRRIGFVGYSLGGMTGLHLGGAVAQNLKQFYTANHANIEAQIGPVSLETIQFTEGEKPHIDRRIQAMLLICPATYAFSSEAIKKIEPSLGLIATTDDEVLNHHQHASRLIQNKTPAKLKLLKDRKISHYAFLNRVGENSKSYVPKHLAFDPPEYNRQDIHAEVAEFARQFFAEKFNLDE